MRTPDFVIGGPDRPYLRRWYLLPRNRFINVYLHEILRDDDDRALHDHPWWNLSIILRGRYAEMRHSGLLRPWRVVFRLPTTAHRLIVVDGPVWSLFVTGPIVREWGFHCPQGWRHWREFVDQRDTGLAGKGCE